MDIPAPANLLFQLIDQDLDYFAKALRQAVFSNYRDLPWTHEQRESLQPLLQPILAQLIDHILGVCNNIGGVIPDNDEDIIGYRIKAVVYPEDSEAGGYEEANEYRETDISDGYIDYRELWRIYLYNKRQSQSNTEETD
jgi:hypothetical protein